MKLDEKCDLKLCKKSEEKIQNGRNRGLERVLRSVLRLSNGVVVLWQTTNSAMEPSTQFKPTNQMNLFIKYIKVSKISQIQKLKGTINISLVALPAEPPVQQAHKRHSIVFATFFWLHSHTRFLSLTLHLSYCVRLFSVDKGGVELLESGDQSSQTHAILEILKEVTNKHGKWFQPSRKMFHKYTATLHGIHIPQLLISVAD